MLRHRIIALAAATVATALCAPSFTQPSTPAASAAGGDVAYLEILGRLDSRWTDAVVHRGHVYQAGYGTVTVFDVRDPARLPVAGRAILDPEQPIHKLVAEGDWVFATSTDTLWAIDVRDPRNPVPVPAHRWRLSPPPAVASTHALAVVDGLAYVSLAGAPYPHWSPRETYVAVVDVRDPRSARELARLSVPRPPDDDGMPWVGAIAATAEHVAFLTFNTDADENDYRVLHVVDVRDPARPAITSSTSLRYEYLEFDEDESIEFEIVDDVLVIAQMGGLYMAELGHADGPHLVSEIRLDPPVTNLTRDGTRIYAALANGKIHVLDASEPRAPRPVGVIQGWTLGHFMDVLAAGDGQVIAARTEGEVHVFRAAEAAGLSAPVTFYLPSQHCQFAVVGNTAYVSSNGLLVADVSDPERPQIIGRAADAVGSAIIQVSQGHVFTWDTRDGLGVFDVRDPAKPAQVAHLEVNQWRGGLAVRDRMAYVAAGDTLSVLDISDPAAPRPRGVASGIDGGSYDIAASPTHVYLAMSEVWRTVDVRDPDAPRLVDTQSLPRVEHISGVAVAGDRLYLTGRMGDGSSRASLAIYDLADPGHPQLVSETVVGYSHNGQIAVAGNLAFISTNASIAVVDVSDAAAPRLVNPDRALIWSGTTRYFRNWEPGEIALGDGFLLATGLSVMRLVHGPAVAPAMTAAALPTTTALPPGDTPTPTPRNTATPRPPRPTPSPAPTSSPSATVPADPTPVPFGRAFLPVLGSVSMPGDRRGVEDRGPGSA